MGIAQKMQHKGEDLLTSRYTSWPGLGDSLYSHGKIANLACFNFPEEMEDQV